MEPKEAFLRALAYITEQYGRESMIPVEALKDRFVVYNDLTGFINRFTYLLAGACTVGALRVTLTGDRPVAVFEIADRSKLADIPAVPHERPAAAARQCEWRRLGLAPPTRAVKDTHIAQTA